MLQVRAWWPPSGAAGHLIKIQSPTTRVLVLTPFFFACVKRYVKRHVGIGEGFDMLKTVTGRSWVQPIKTQGLWQDFSKWFSTGFYRSPVKHLIKNGFQPEAIEKSFCNLYYRGEAKNSGFPRLIPHMWHEKYREATTTTILPNTLENGFSSTKEVILPLHPQPQLFQPQPQLCQRGP
jgi:hypothetical protein